MARLKDISKNLNAFLDMLSFSEGTYKYGTDQGYNVIVGGSTFSQYSDHPRKLIPLPKLGIKSTAAGRYQLLQRYYDAYTKQLGLKDFSPENQDKIAIQQIKERKALQDIENGDIVSAINKCKNIWAQLPGAGYGQYEHKVDPLLKKYVEYGGSLK